MFEKVYCNVLGIDYCNGMRIPFFEGNVTTSHILFTNENTMNEIELDGSAYIGINHIKYLWYKMAIKKAYNNVYHLEKHYCNRKWDGVVYVK